jgi:hypothetical protein
VDSQESGGSDDESAEPESLRLRRGTGEGSDRKKGPDSPPAFCTNSVVNMTCKQQYPNQKLFCYKEKWTVDGTTSKKNIFFSEYTYFMTIDTFFSGKAGLRSRG